MLKGARGEKRDPTRLLREEKMRKRIAKELPKVTQDLQHKLEQWERDYDRPFLVKGVRFLEEIEDVAPLKPSESARSKTPSMPPPITRSSRTQQPTNLRNMPTSSRSAAPSRAGARTPMQPIIIKGAQNSAMSVCSTASSGRMSPTKIPGARKPFAELGQQPASPRRHLPPTIKAEFGNIKRPMQLPTAPPPRMRDLPEHKVDNYYYGSESQARCESALSSQGSVRHRQREDMFGNASEWEDHQAVYGVPSGTSRVFEDYSSRLPSATSATTVSGSENWETYDDGSENEANGGDQRRKQADQGYVMAATAPSHGQKHAAAVRSMVGPVQIVGESGRLASGSEAGWTDASGEVF